MAVQVVETGTLFAFGPFELDTAAFVLRRDRDVVKLAPKAFDLLLYLIERRARVVGKSELLDRLWPGEHVTEGVLPSHVRQLRRALGDSRSQPSLIATVHGRGYRFIGRVTELPAAAGGVEARSGLVGRRDALEELTSRLAATEDGRGSLVLLAGEPGIGKTRTAEEVCQIAGVRGFRVLRGRCYEGEGAPAFWPWIQLLRGALQQEADDAAVLRHLGAGASDVAHLLPELRERLPDLPAAPALESDEARFRVFESVGGFLASLSAERPLLLFADDLHWADEPTLLLLSFLARYEGDARLLILGAYRDVELRRDHALARLLGEMAREDRYRRITLRGLSREEVAQYVERELGSAPPRLVERVFEMTQGNPFFLRETVHLLASRDVRDGDADEPHIALPQGVREAVGRRLSGLSEACNRVLGLAAVIGSEFDLNVLEAVSGLSRAALLEVIEEALAAGVLRDASDARGARELPLARFGFFHVLIRETLYDELTPIQRIRIHRDVADALERLDAGSGRHLPELAHHALQAAPGGDAGRAVLFGTRAAEQATALLAFEEAVRHYRRCLEALELAAPPDPSQRYPLLSGLGWALHRCERFQDARDTFQQVAALARRCRRWEWLADAAMGIGGWPPVSGAEATLVNPEFRALVEEAVLQLGEEPTPLRSRLLSALSLTPPDQDSMERRHELSSQALAIAQRSGDTDALFDAWIARMWALLGPDEAAERLEAADEMRELARRVGARDREFTAEEDRVRSLFALGDLAGVDRGIEAMDAIAGELRLWEFRNSVRRMRIVRALGEGRLEQAWAWLDAWEAEEQKPMHSAVQVGIAVLRGIVLHEQGRFRDVMPLVEDFLAISDWAGEGVRAAVAWFCADDGDLESARDFLHRMQSAPRGWRRDEGWLVAVYYASLAAAELRDAWVAELDALLRPFARQPVVHQRGRIFVGSSSLALARLAEALGDAERAGARYEEALAHNEALGARPALARTHAAYARFLAGGGSSEAAGLHRERAGALAREMGMQGLLARLAGRQ